MLANFQFTNKYAPIQNMPYTRWTTARFCSEGEKHWWLRAINPLPLRTELSYTTLDIWTDALVRIFFKISDKLHRQNEDQLLQKKVKESNVAIPANNRVEWMHVFVRCWLSVIVARGGSTTSKKVVESLLLTTTTSSALTTDYTSVRRDDMQLFGIERKQHIITSIRATTWQRNENLLNKLLTLLALPRIATTFPCSWLAVVLFTTTNGSYFWRIAENKVMINQIDSTLQSISMSSEAWYWRSLGSQGLNECVSYPAGCR